MAVELDMEETTVVPGIILLPGRISGVPQEGPGGTDNFTYSLHRPDGGHWSSVDLWSLYI